MEGDVLSTGDAPFGKLRAQKKPNTFVSAFDVIPPRSYDFCIKYIILDIYRVLKTHYATIVQQIQQ